MKLVSLISFLLLFGSQIVLAQSNPDLLNHNYFLLENRISSQNDYATTSNDSLNREEYPKPKSVMLKSLMIPGWGQIENKQIWKVPIIYGLFAGIGYYTYTLNSDYKDYKAAYYNSFPDNDDMRFGPTPEYLQGVNANQLQSNRNSLRNQRDFMFVVMGLAYGLNVIDAYVFAHMRSFDVSDDLSANAIVQPALIENRSPGISLKINLQKRN